MEVGAGAPIEGMTTAQIESAVRVANVPALLMLVYQFTGDQAWLASEYRPSRGKGLDDNDSGGLSPNIQNRIRRAAVDVLVRQQRGERLAIDILEPDRMVEAMAFYMGEEVGSEYGEMLSTEFARRAGHLSGGPGVISSPKGFRVAILGAGVGGIAAARQCQEFGIDFVLFEQADGPGGVWWKNSYPGAGVDTPSHLYSLSFARHDWSTHFAMRDEIQEYLEAALNEIIDRGADVRFNVDIERMTWIAEAQQWHLSLRQGDQLTDMSANAVICSVGGLDRPVVPDVPGRHAFEGQAFHSARWPKNLDLTGKRVVVVGTGASAMQIVPAIAETVAQLTVIQRSPQWVAPFTKFKRGISPDLRTLLAASPTYYGWYWLRLFWQFGDNVLETLRKDPDWGHSERSVNARNDGHRKFFTTHMTDRLGRRQDLLPLVVPDYPPFGKRILLDNGWYETLCLPNVTLVADSVVGMDREGILTSGGRHEADVVVWATGFEASRFVGSVEVLGASGHSLRDTWADDDPRAYLGVSVPDFPNFFMLGGPNSFPGSGSIMFWLELQARHVCGGLLARMVEEGITSVVVKRDVHDAYNQLIDQEHDEMIWTHPGMRTYYRNARGRVVFVSPFRNVDFWGKLRDAGLPDYTVTRAVDARIQGYGGRLLGVK